MKKIATILALFPLTASAHESHGNHFYEMLRHVFSSPEHVWPLTLGIAIVAFLLIKKRS
jgi:hypothetical protein